MSLTVFSKVVKISAVLFSLLTLLISLGALLSSHWYGSPPIITFCGLILPIVLIINIVLTVGWMLTRRIWVLLPLASIILSYPFISAVVQPSDNKSDTLPTSAQKINLCSYNIQGVSYGLADLTLGLLADYVSMQEIDILCLQEVDETLKAPLDSLLATKAGLRYAATAAGPRPGYMLTVHSRYPLLNAVDIRFNHTGNHALHTDVAIQGDTLRLYNVHLQTTHFNQLKHDIHSNNGSRSKGSKLLVDGMHANTVKRNHQAQVLTKGIRQSPYPVIACGDFNAHPASLTYTLFNRTLADGFKTAGHGYEYTYRYLGNLLRIDYIFHDKALEGLSYRSDELDFSDHKAVFFNLVLNRPAE